MRIENAEARIFRTVVEENGFRRAAERLHLSQSAVSQSLKQLEDKLGLVLIRRTQPPQLTEAGRRFLQYAYDMGRQEKSVLEDIDRLRRGGGDVLSVAINSVINRYQAPQLIGAFCRGNQQTKLKVEELPSREIIYAVLSGRCELGLGPFQTHMNAYDTIPLFDENRLLVASPQHPDAAQLQSDPEQALRDTPLIASYLDEPSLRPSMDKMRYGFASVWEVSSLGLRLQLIAEGFGVSYISEHLLQREPLCRSFIRLDQLAFGRIPRKVGLYYKKGRELSRAAIDFIGICKDELFANN
jgi:DNA-binding transcriptional LysR family regulator